MKIYSKNLILLAFAMVLLIFFGRVDSFSEDSQVNKTGYKLYLDRAPLRVFVANQFPSNESMMVSSDAIRSRQVIFTFDDNNSVHKPGRATVSVGANVHVGVETDEKGNPVSMIMLLSTSESLVIFRDLNLDGEWDVKYMPKLKKQFIMLERNWIVVDKVLGEWPNVKAISGPRSYMFTKSGQWTDN